MCIYFSRLIIMVFFCTSCSFVPAGLHLSGKQSKNQVKELSQVQHCPFDTSSFVWASSDLMLKKELRNYCLTKPFTQCLLASLTLSFVSRPENWKNDWTMTLFWTEGHKINVIENTPVFEAMIHLAKQWKLTSWYEQDFRQWIKQIQWQVKVTADQEKFFASTKNSMSEQDKKFFLRGDDSLSTNEYLPMSYLLENFLKEWDRQKKISSLVIVKDIESQEPVLCNFPVEEYSQGKISPMNQEMSSITAGLNSNKQWSFWVASDIRPKGRPIPWCYYALKEKKNILLTSVTGRDPEQYLTHLMDYNIVDVNTQSEFEHLLSFPRHLVLAHPLRLSMEVSRATTDQLNEILKLHIPLYDEKKLGHLFGLYKLEQTEFIVDDRSEMNLQCKP